MTNFTARRDVSKLLKKLKKGQDDLKKSLQILDDEEMQNVRRQQLTRRHLAEKPINSVKDVCKKRARVELMSPGTEPKGREKHPRRFSSTPKKCDGPLVSFSAPEIDSSLEEALLDRPSHPHTTTHLPSPRLSQVAINTSRKLRDSPHSHSFLRTSRLKERNPSKRGLSVSFINDESRSRTPTKSRERSLSPSEKRKRLVDSLNASKHGALDHTLSQQKRKFPRKYAGVDPKLGYDWIAGLIDASDSYLSERDDGYFQDLKEFRRVNCSECYKQSESANLVNDPLLSHSTAPSDYNKDAANSDCTTCVKSYSLNDRLFPIPRLTNADVLREGGCGALEATCPVCEDKHTDSKSPVRYIRVSVPKRTLQSSYQLRPHRRRSFEPSDSMGLSKHCLVGWESAKPFMIPSQPSVGLRDALRKEPLLSSADLLNTSHRVEYNLRSRSIK